MDYWFVDMPIELRMDGRTGAIREASGYVEIIPDINVAPHVRTSNWTLGHVMLVAGDHVVFADSWQERQVHRAILTSTSHVERIRLMWGRSQRDMRAAFEREASYA